MDFLYALEKMYGFYPTEIDEHLLNDANKTIITQRNNELYNMLWGRFEYHLGHPDENEIESVCLMAADSMSDIEFGGFGDTLDYYFEEQFKFIQDLQQYLLEWVKQISLDNTKILKESLFRNTSDYFLTFNYTPVLEDLYRIENNHICHIHGGLPSCCPVSPIIGHGNHYAIKQRQKLKKECDELFDEAKSSMNLAFAKFYKRTLKDTDQALCQNNDFFDKISDAKEVLVIGHSLGEVDFPYFKKINQVLPHNIPWKIYYLNEDEYEEKKRSMIRIGVTKFVMESSELFWKD